LLILSESKGILSNILSILRNEITLEPAIALILGSGLGEFADKLVSSVSIPTSTLPGYPHSSVQGHAGKIVVGHLAEDPRCRPLMVFKGRVHYYESGDLEKTLLPVDIAFEMGARTLIVTSAAGGINPRFRAGDLMVIEDYLTIGTKGIGQLMGGQTSEVHLRFEKTTGKIDMELSVHLKQSAQKIGMPIQVGTYCWLLGPTYETPAEIEMLRRLGADAVGMSTVPELVRGSQLGMRVGGISLISNLAAGMSGEKLSHDEVTEAAKRVAVHFSNLMTTILTTLPK
jgi:purine-nucleoside phosphorylase